MLCHEFHQMVQGLQGILTAMPGTRINITNVTNFDEEMESTL